ncbi:serine hydrolase domain-containing protein [Saccharopolyspora gloriosae]|uniref:CubicO group peptidase (Beta-lactamase class C family) n=1 Tax=Saccharopolyspora gloriosae TaxID=455344 RepID=A0A840NPN4_9PSEU|nr:serine hydrolase domain-containing protein [Saccharopolyspora gloriosae]MBB5072318.1 CubicO group peptidase (beta-lactamase class C family) [Saccharopolyspora gloriosae]
MRRTLSALVLASVAAATASPACASAPEGPGGRFDRPQEGFASSDTVLRPGSAQEAGLDARPIDAAMRRIAAWTEVTPGRQHPMYAGAVALLAHDGVVVRQDAFGREIRYADGRGTELPPQQQEPMRPDTIFDVASITKLFTSIAALQQVEDGGVELDAPVARYLSEFGVNGKEAITVRQLLTHTSGLQAEVQLWKLPPHERIPHVMNLTPQHPPGSGYEYSDPNMITLGLLVARVAGEPLDEVVRHRITEPLGMVDTGYNPPADKRDRIAATEFQADPPRGMVRGQVHDENAWSLGGVAGEAGIFSTAHDLAILGQALLNGGTYGEAEVLDEDSVDRMLTDFNGGFPGNSHGLGFELDQRWYMAGLSSPRTAGHTGYTGTSLVLDPLSRSVVVLLTNRVHPSREWGSNNEARQALAQGMAESLAVRPTRGSREWAAPAAAPATLTTRELGPVAGPAEVTFDSFVDTQRDGDGVDALTVESSADGGRSWRRVPVTAAGAGAPDGPQQELAGSGHRAWWQVRGTVDAQPGQRVQLRWRYSPDDQYVGRGVLLDGISVADQRRTLLDGEREPGGLVAQGWRQVDR